ncbi:hypothetical protein EXIGLDRAFT_763696 [Exidia glandulosa HHB12029]|uniref:Ricin B lectin domain-containing protein n=1 Tax=Exidia glandulosa HHB12029 TaxID=1314781 RepID=A0A165LR49_EXIGL|nr:hypothetical protein EXIGLDRAFT_763696 [Exidia glandulosa HHB12029]
MRITSIGSFALTALATARAISITTSGVYTLTIAGRALTHGNATAPVTAEIPSRAANQAWTVFFVADGVVSLQNVATLEFAAITRGNPGIVGTNSSFGWVLFESNLFCTGTDSAFCISLVSSNGQLSLVNPGNPENLPQVFDATPIPPPRAWYEVHNVATNRIIGATPGFTFLSTYPASDRSEIWLVQPQENSSTIALQNLDTSVWLTAESNGNVTAVFDPPAPWIVAFPAGLGQTLTPASSGFLQVTAGTSLVIDSFTGQTSTWVFHPVDPAPFLPRRV